MSICIDYKKLLAHRVAWVYFYGIEPNKIDHINGIRTDNRISNLRDTNSIGNARNTEIKCTNKSGVTGVSWDKKNKKWQVSITVNYKTIFIGRYSLLGDAAKQRKLAEEKYGFHKNHGRSK